MPIGGLVAGGTCSGFRPRLHRIHFATGRPSGTRHPSPMEADMVILLMALAGWIVVRVVDVLADAEPESEADKTAAR